MPLGRIAPGQPVYSDRSFTYQRVPQAFHELTSLLTANDDKRTRALLTFSLGHAAQVFVAHDPRIKRKPDWLSAFRHTGQALTVNEGGEDQNETVYEVFVKDFPSGSVRLGPNVGLRAKKRVSMYLVFVGPL